MLASKMVPVLGALVVASALTGCLEAGGSNPAGGGGFGNGGGGNGGGGNGGDVGNAGRCDGRLGSGAGTASGNVGAGCLGCSVTDPANVLSADGNDFATISAAVGLLPVGGLSSVGIDVQLNSAVTPVDRNPGFVISFQDVPTLSVGALPDLTISTLSGGNVVDSETYPFGVLQDSIALGALGLLDINNAEVFLGVPATAQYDGLRVELSGLVANALVNIDVHDVCTDGVSGSISGDFPI